MKMLSLIMSVLFTANIYAIDKIVMLNDGKDIKLSYNDIEKLGGKIIKELSIINAIVVKFPDYIKDSEIYSLGYVKKVEDDLYIKWIEETILPELPSVESVRKNIEERNYDYSISEPSFSTDKFTDEELNEIPWGVKRVNAYKAWNWTTGKDVKVGVIDTGIDYNHPDLKANYAGGYNAIDPSKTPLDDNGHGTHVAGTIAAVKDLKGVVGVAPDVKLYAVKVLNAGGSGTYSAVIDGIQWAVNNKMDVINMSLGSRYGSDSLKAAIEAAYKSGVVVVCAAGNDGGAVNYPAKYPGAIAVSALTSSDNIASFSSRGPEIAFIAPGVNIYSTWMDGKYRTASGTSMASPHVAGLAALVVGLGVTNPDEVKQVLIKSAVKLPNLKDTEQGNGVIDASKFYDILQDTEVKTDINFLNVNETYSKREICQKNFDSDNYISIIQKAIPIPHPTPFPPVPHPLPIPSNPPNEQVENCKKQCDDDYQLLIDNCNNHFPDDATKRKLCYESAMTVYSRCLRNCEGGKNERI